MIGITVRHDLAEGIGVLQRIPHFQVILASGLLADVAPRWYRVCTQRIVHPFPDFMGGRIGIEKLYPSGVKLHWRIRLYRAPVRSVISDITAVLRITDVHHDIV